MPYGTHLHCFKKGIKPVWEDAALEKGCQIEFKTQKVQTSKLWEDLLLAYLGEQFENGQPIAGVVLKLKPAFDKIGIWLNNDQSPEAIEQTKKDLITLLKIKAKDIEFLDFQEQKNKPVEKRPKYNKKKDLKSDNKDFKRNGKKVATEVDEL